MCKIRTYARFSENPPGRGRKRGHVPGRMITLLRQMGDIKTLQQCSRPRGGWLPSSLQWTVNTLHTMQIRLLLVRNCRILLYISKMTIKKQSQVTDILTFSRPVHCSLSKRQRLSWLTRGCYWRWCKVCMIIFAWQQITAHENIQ